MLLWSIPNLIEEVQCARMFLGHDRGNSTYSRDSKAKAIENDKRNQRGNLRSSLKWIEYSNLYFIQVKRIMSMNVLLKLDNANNTLQYAQNSHGINAAASGSVLVVAVVAHNRFWWWWCFVLCLGKGSLQSFSESVILDWKWAKISTRADAWFRRVQLEHCVNNNCIPISQSTNQIDQYVRKQKNTWRNCFNTASKVPLVYLPCVLSEVSTRFHPETPKLQLKIPFRSLLLGIRTEFLQITCNILAEYISINCQSNPC